MTRPVQLDASNDTAARGEAFAKLPTELIRDRTLPDSAKVLYAEICTYAWESIGSDCTASQATLATDLGWSRRKLQRATDDLLERDLITLERTGRTNRCRPVAVKNDASDASPMTHQMRHQRRIKQTKEEDEKSSSSSAAAETTAPDRATERPTTTTKTSFFVDMGDEDQKPETADDQTTATADNQITAVEDDRFAKPGENLLDDYDQVIENETGRCPVRQPGDWDAAIRLEARIKELIADGVHGDHCLTPSIILGWGMEDRAYTRPRLLNGFRAAARCYEALARRYAAASRVTCDHCSEKFPAHANETHCPECETYLAAITGQEAA